VSDSGGPGQREVAYRLFAAEFEDSDFSYSEGDEERAPNYVVTPTGARVNRLFAVGVLTEVEAVSEDVLRARIVDPTGAFVLYAGQYQPDEQAFLERAEPPAFVAVTGKARTFQPDDSDRVYSSVRPETISEVDAETRDRWTVGAAEQTLNRVTRMAAAKRLDARGDDLAATLRERGLPDGLAEGISLAFDHYGTTGEYLESVHRMALEAAGLVAGETDEVEPSALAPGEGTDAPLGDLAAADLDEPAAGASTTAVGEPDVPTAEAGTAADADPASPDLGPDSRAEGGTADGERTAEDENEDETPVPTAQTVETEGETEAETATPSLGTDTTAAASGETAAGPDTDAEAGTDEELGDFDSAEFELDEEQREEIESEFGTDFQSGTEVEEPGEADIETPEPEADEADAGDAGETTAPGDTAGAEEDDDSPSEPADIVDTVVAVMTELDDGDGADRDEVVDVVRERYDASPEAIDDAVQEALMDGRCYEPDDATLKPI